METANPYSAPAAALESDQKTCASCGAAIRKLAEMCPACGVRQPGLVNKTTLLLITFFLGGLGGHKFYLGKWVQGIFYFLFFWLWIPALIALVELIVYACTSSERLNEKYSAHGSSAAVSIAAAVACLAIIGILAAIAIPAYQDRFVRGRASNVLMGMLAHKTAVNEYFEQQRQLPVTGAEVKMAAVTVPHTMSVKIARGGAIVATVSSGVHTSMTGKAMLLVPKIEGNDLVWTCGVQEQPMERYVSGNCRNVLPLP